MKTLNNIFFAAIAATAMTACNNELNNDSLSNNGIINFNMGIGTTQSSRTSMEDNSYKATFSKNDEVGIFVNEVSSYNNVKYTTTDGTNWEGTPIKAPANEEFTYTFYAYYPYADATTTTINKTVALDQNTEGFIKNDFLISTATTSNQTVNLEFAHAFSLVEVTLKGNGAAEGATVNILNVATDATIDLTNQTVTTGETKGNVVMDALQTPLKYRAIVPEQTISAQTPVFKIAVNGKTYEAKYTSEIKFEKGKYLAMTITLGEEEGPAEIEITTSASINDWTEGSIAGGDITVEEVPLIAPLGESLENATKEPNFNKSTWFVLKQNDNTPGIECSIEADPSTNWEKAICFKYTSTWDFDFDNGTDGDGNPKPAGKKYTDSWYIGTIGYYHCSTEAPISQSIYKVTLKIKGKPDSQYSETSKLVFTCRNAKNDASFAISTSTNEDTFTATTVSKTPASPDTWEDLTLYINFAKKSTDAPGSKVNIIDTVADDLTKFDLRVYTNNPVKTTPEGEDLSNTATIYIADVVMEPYTGE